MFYFHVLLYVFSGLLSVQA